MTPTGPEDHPLTARQQRILDFIAATVRDRGYPPTVREIGEAVGLTSSSSVHAQLANLERLGLLHKDPTKPRAMTLSDSLSAISTSAGITYGARSAKARSFRNAATITTRRAC